MWHKGAITNTVAIRDLKWNEPRWLWATICLFLQIWLTAHKKTSHFLNTCFLKEFLAIICDVQTQKYVVQESTLCPNHTAFSANSDHLELNMTKPKIPMSTTASRLEPKMSVTNMVSVCDYNLSSAPELCGLMTRWCWTRTLWCHSDTDPH